MNIYVWIAWSVGMVIVWGVVPALVVFFVVRAVRRHGVRGAAQAGGIGLGRLIKGTFEVIAAVLTGILGIAGAASAAKGSEKRPLIDLRDDEPWNNGQGIWDRPEGSHFNHRTGRFDDGMDPAGHYTGFLPFSAMPGPSSYGYWDDEE